MRPRIIKLAIILRQPTAIKNRAVVVAVKHHPYFLASSSTLNFDFDVLVAGAWLTGLHFSTVISIDWSISYSLAVGATYSYI